MTEKNIEFRFPELKWSHTDNAVGRAISYTLGKITKETNLDKGIKRPISLRSERADIYNEILKTKDRDKKVSLIEKAHELDNLFSQFHKGKKSIEVEIEGLGKQSAEYAELKSKDADLNKAPIVLILGISNDLDGAGDFPIKLAMVSKRKTVVFTYPESWHGKVTKEFGEAVGKSDKFKPHVDFFRSAINQVVGSETEIDICGISAGAIMTSELIKDKEFNKRINQANLIVPPGIVDMDMKNVIKGLSREFKSLIFNKKDSRKISILNPEKIKKTADERKNAIVTFTNLAKKLSQEYPWWKSELLSGKGRKTKVIICEQDGVTNGVDGLEKIKENKNLEVVLMKNSSHETPASNPEGVIEQMTV